MFKNELLVKTVSLTVMGAFALVSSPKRLEAAMLVPVSFSQMYNLAQNGEVEALRGSVRRGMNIDVMNQNGDTGLCIAARRRDSATYNAFRAAGANPRHPCTQSIPGYEQFVNSANTVPINSTSRAAYGMMGKESYQVSSWVWWALGAAAAGAGIALAAGGGGGGGGGGSSSGSSSSKDKNIDSAGKQLAKNGTVIYTSKQGEQRTNSSTLTLSNTKTDVIDALNFNLNVEDNSKDLNVILRALNGGSYVNSENTVITANSGVVGMSAYKNSSLITNNGRINVNGNNAAIGMLAGQAAYARNNGQDPNGIYMSFSGTETNHSLIGMYADVGAKIYNSGLISGTSAVDATKGSMVGMEAVIVNSNINSKNTTSTLTNTDSGSITLIAGAGEDSEINLIGMGSYLDNGFLEGPKIINSAERVLLLNKGDITLSYLRHYISSEDYFRKGIGGIVGMKADANTTANNEKNITIKISNLEPSSLTSDYAMLAGMQSVHGGVITNLSTGNIVVDANIHDSSENNQSAYGMVAVAGGGKVAETLGKLPTVTNEGNISLNINNGYAMATYNGGTLINDNTITLGNVDSAYYENNVGMYDSGDGSESATLENSGEIIIYSSASVGMQNDFENSEITNDGTITIHKSATTSHPFAGNYSKLTNNGTIDYRTTPEDVIGSGGSFPDNFSFDLQDAVISTKGDNSLTASGSNKSTITISNNGTITLSGSSYTAAIMNHNALGSVTNEKGKQITINDREGDEAGTGLKNIGIYVSNSVANGSTATNKGTITVKTKYSAGMASNAVADSVLLNNTGLIQMEGDYSIGMFASDSGSIRNKRSNSTDEKARIVTYGQNSYGIVVKGKGELGAKQEIENDIIELHGDNSTGIYIADNSTAVIKTFGTIKVYADNATGIRFGKGLVLEELPEFELNSYKPSFTYFNIANGEMEIKISGYTSTSSYVSEGQTFALADGSGNILNKTNIKTGIADSTLLMGLSEGLTSINSSPAILTVNHENSTAMYAANGHTIRNAGTIVIEEGADHSYGMYADADSTAENYSSITVDADNSYGMYAANGATVTNNSYISVIGKNAYGMYAASGGTAVNEQIISVDGIGSYGMYAAAGGKITNNGSIYVDAAGAYGMFAVSTNPKSENKGHIEASEGYRLNDNVDDKEPAATPSAAPSLSMAPLSLSTPMMASNSSTIVNNGLISSNSSFDFDNYSDSTSSINIGNGGTFAASSFSGNVVADANIVNSGFENIYTNTDSFVGEDNGLNITSGSYLFDAKKSLNDDGNIDVVMSKKDFAAVVENSSLAEFLEQNYADKNNESLYAALKSSGTSAQFNHNLDSLFGKELLSDLTFEDLNILHELNFNMNNTIFAQKKGSFALADGTDLIKGGQKSASSGQYALSGYNDGKTSVAVGLAVSDIRAMKNANNQRAKLNKNIMLSVPVARKAHGFEFITAPKFGYAEGSYEREGLNGITYNGKIEKRMFALMNEARYPLNFNGTKLIPTAEFNMISYNIKGREEQKQYSLNIDSQNHYSVESGLGLNLEREFSLSKDSQLKLNGGVAVYKEFADPYELKVGMNEMNGTYRLKSEKYGDKRTVLRFGAGYNLKENLEFTVGLRTNIAHDYRTDAGINLNYGF